MSFISMFRKPAAETLLARLGAAYEGTLPPGAGGPDRFEFDVTHRVQIWVDRAHAVPSCFGTLTAYRAITVTGDLIWFVHEHSRNDRYHAQADTAEEAMRMANAAWEQARRACGQSAALTALASDLRRGRKKLTVTLEDATLTPLSAFGLRAILDQAGLFGLSSLSGHTLVRLMRKEPQLAYVLHAAWERSQEGPEAPVLHPDTGGDFAALC